MEQAILTLFGRLNTLYFNYSHKKGSFPLYVLMTPISSILLSQINCQNLIRILGQWDCKQYNKCCLDTTCNNSFYVSSSLHEIPLPLSLYILSLEYCH